MQIRRHREHLRNLVTCSDVRRIRRKTHGSHCLEWIHNWSTRHRNETRQWSLTVYSGFAKQLINLLLYVSFLLQRTSIFRPQNCLAYACCMKPGCSEMTQPAFPHSLYSHGINQSSSMCLFYSKEPAYLGLKIAYIAYARCMKLGCSEMTQPVFPHRAARNTSLLHHSLLTTHYHTDTMLTSSLSSWCAAGVGFVCRNSV